MVTTPLGRLNVSLATGAGLFVALVVPVLTFAAGRIAFGLEAVVDNSAGVLAGVASVFLTGVLVSTLGLSSDVQLATSRAQRPDLNMIAHAAIDAIGLLVAPMAGHSS